jgi:hypothetical protein
MERVGERREKIRASFDRCHFPFLQHLIDVRSGKLKYKSSDSELVVVCGSSLDELEERVGTLVFD